jgi:hypothetical protein
METQIQQKKSEVLLLVSQSEARHLERKCESQAKELMRIKDSAEKYKQLSENAISNTEGLGPRLCVRTEKVDINTPSMESTQQVIMTPSSFADKHIHQSAI